MRAALQTRVQRPLGKLRDSFEQRISAGRINTFVKSGTGITIADAGTANIFKDHLFGLLIPIDVHMRAPAAVLQTAWAD